jgi:hypothetical protein
MTNGMSEKPSVHLRRNLANKFPTFSPMCLQSFPDRPGQRKLELSVIFQGTAESGSFDVSFLTAARLKKFMQHRSRVLDFTIACLRNERFLCAAGFCGSA